MANVILKGVCYGTDGKTPLKTAQVTINIKNSAMVLVKTGTSSLVDGSYNLTYDNSLLVQTDFKIVVEYKRADSGNTLTINGLSGFNAFAQTLNPVPPT